eukprot:203537_1
MSATNQMKATKSRRRTRIEKKASLVRHLSRQCGSPMLYILSAIGLLIAAEMAGSRLLDGTVIKPTIAPSLSGPTAMPCQGPPPGIQAVNNREDVAPIPSVSPVQAAAPPALCPPEIEADQEKVAWASPSPQPCSRPPTCPTHHHDEE